MVFIKHDSGKVNFIHYLPFHEEYGMKKTQEELELEGILVENVPKPVTQEGKNAVMRYNIETKKITYDYEDIPKTEEDIQQQKIQELENALLEMPTLQAIKDLENEQAIMELTMMIGGM